MKDFKTLKDKIQRGDASEEEVERFRQYIERVALEEMQRAIVDPPGRDRAEEWRGVQARIQAQENEQQEGASRYLYLLSRVAAVVIAAAVIGAFVVYFWRKETPQPQAASTIKMIQGKNHIKLADGTTVDLNEGSTLRYGADFDTAKERIVELEGEGFFEVTHNPARPFRVKTGDVVTTVLGTAFDIRAYGDQSDIIVTVAQGKVSVAAKDAPIALLTKDQQMTYHKVSRKAETKKLDVVQTEWKDSYLVFDDETMATVVEKLGERFDVKISFQDSGIQGCHVRMVYVHGEGIEQILDDLMAINQATYERNQTGIVITGGVPCPAPE